MQSFGANHSRGPGLGIRVLGEITEDKLQIVRDSDAILREEIAAAGLDRDIWQYFTVLRHPLSRRYGRWPYLRLHSRYPCCDFYRRHDR